MGTAERRQKIMQILSMRRHETASNLAREFGVSTRTIRRDIEILSLTEPIYTQSGRYLGGIYIVDGYNLGHLYMTDDEITILSKVYSYICLHKIPVLNKSGLNLFKKIIDTYARPDYRKDEKDGKT